MSKKELDESVVHCRQELHLCSLGSPYRSYWLDELAIALADRFKQLGQLEDLDEAITHGREALDLRPPGHPDRSRSLNNLAADVHTRFKQQGQIADLDEAITYHRQALDLRPSGDPNRSSSLNNLAVAVQTRFDQRGEIEDLDEAITCHRQALDLCPPGHSNRSMSLNNLANAVQTRFNKQGEIEDLDEAITYHREALNLRPSGHPNRSSSLNNLAVAVQTRFDKRGEIEDLDEAITCHRQALDLCPPGHYNRSMSLNNLAMAALTRFNQRGEIEDLDEAITYGREALDLRPPGHPDHSHSLNNLALAVWIRFGQRGQIEDLDEAITCHRQALNLSPPGHPDHSSSLNNLAIAVQTRFHQRGDIEDLDEAITCHREELDLCPPGHPNRSMSLNNLANAVQTRFEQCGEIEDLDEAITCNREALDLCPPGHPDRSHSLNNLAVAVWTRFGQQGQIEDLDEAITRHRQALDLCPPGHYNRSMSLNNLAMAALTRFNQRGEIEDLDEAITCNREALDLRPRGHPDRYMSLQNLANSLSSRFRRLGKTEYLEEAIEHLFDAEDTLPIPHPGHASIRSDLATYLLQHKSHPQPDDCLAQPFRLFENATNHATASSMDRFKAAQRWAQEARRCKHPSTLQAHSVSLTLLDRYLNVTPDIESQQHVLATTSSVPRSLASDAASSAIAVGQLETAVELLEQGRAILWSKLRGYRYPLEQLRIVDRQLADHFEALSAQLEHLAISAGSESTLPGPDKAGPAGSTALDAKMHRHHTLSKDWDNIVEKIRQVEGFTHFLQAVPFATLHLASAEGPVIVVNISEYRSDAIILYGIRPPTLVPLPDASPKQLVALSSQLSDARVKRTPRRIVPVLQSLWDTIVVPVTNELVALGVAKKSRIWWCPTSELCDLPLHAAGPYKPSERNLPDLYISSYTPTLSTLIRARSGFVPSLAIPNLLVMGQPGDRDSATALPAVTEEIKCICSFGDFGDVLAAGEANRQAVLFGLRRHNWIHFACHGHLVKQPFHSYFQLYDNERLTLLDLIKARLPSAEFAFLSACHSAAGDILGTPDEVIHLAAGVQFSGFRSVVGTLWGMADMDGPDIAHDFYTHMFRNPGGMADFRDSAAALNVATRAMRQKKGVTIDRWINFVHIGA